MSNFKYKRNLAYLHSDDNCMPKNKKAWCSWNSTILKNNIKKFSYLLVNLLQNLKIEKNIFLTLNPHFMKFHETNNIKNSF